MLTDAFPRLILVWVQLWVSAEDGRQDPGKPIKSHGKLGFEYCVPGVVTAQSDVSSLIVSIFRIRMRAQTSPLPSLLPVGALCMVVCVSMDVSASPLR